MSDRIDALKMLMEEIYLTPEPKDFTRLLSLLEWATAALEEKLPVNLDDWRPVPMPEQF